jgi:hypothetical protein
MFQNEGDMMITEKIKKHYVQASPMDQIIDLSEKLHNAVDEQVKLTQDQKSKEDLEKAKKQLEEAIITFSLLRRTKKAA